MRPPVSTPLTARARGLWERLSNEERHWVRYGVYPNAVVVEAIRNHLPVENLAHELTRIAEAEGA